MSRWNKRIRKLRRRYRRDGGVLIMPGGLTTVIQTSNWLDLTLAAMRREHARLSGSPAPVSRFDRTLDLLERADEVGPESPPLLGVAHSVLHQDDNFDAPSTN